MVGLHPIDVTLHVSSVRKVTGPPAPQRTCVGCRQRADQSDLLRVVAVGSLVVPDGHRRQDGRGAYMHPRPECLALAERRRAFPRALRVPGPLSLEAVADVVRGEEMSVQGSGD